LPYFLHAWHFIPSITMTLSRPVFPNNIFPKGHALLRPLLWDRPAAGKKAMDFAVDWFTGQPVNAQATIRCWPVPGEHLRGLRKPEAGSRRGNEADRPLANSKPGPIRPKPAAI
jgi:hypothetical protein